MLSKSRVVLICHCCGLSSTLPLTITLLHLPLEALLLIVRVCTCVIVYNSTTKCIGPEPQMGRQGLGVATVQEGHAAGSATTRQVHSVLSARLPPRGRQVAVVLGRVLLAPLLQELVQLAAGL